MCTMSLLPVIIAACVLPSAAAGLPQQDPEALGIDKAMLLKARDYALTGGGSGIILYGGSQVLSWGDLKKRYDLKSTTKSIGVTALGLALADGRMKLIDKAVGLHPSFAIPPDSNPQTGWIDSITLFHLATQTAGFEKPGGYTQLVFEPGTKWNYSDGGPNWLAECITLAYHRDLNDLLFERVFTPIGITPDDLVWRNNSYRPHAIDGIARREFGSGISANVDAMARIGLLYLGRGKWNDRHILPPDFVDLVRTTPAELKGLPTLIPQEYDSAANHYGLLWWNNADGTIAAVPKDAYWSWGLYDSLIVVIPSRNLVAARAGDSWKRTGGPHYEVLRPFLEPLAAAVPPSRPSPYPPSPVIRTIEWAPRETIIRVAPGSDNWPVTWADDDALYTAYGDGWGFDPQRKLKLSLGLAHITGVPPDLSADNLASPAIEQTGEGPAGKKASGLLMVEGVLYLWARNARNSQLAVSSDHARTWTWCPWRFTQSFGCPTFLNFGPDYAGARDEYVYIYSPDTDSAYVPADTMVLARVPKTRITDRAAYEFFVRLGPDGRPEWTSDLAQRGPVFTNPARCYRSSVTYNAPLKRYLWWQGLPNPGETGDQKNDLRFRGGFAIFDAPGPLGPWTAAFFTESWDVGPGESAAIPVKWISPDGKTFWLVFSGDDAFSLRKGTIIIVE